MAVSPATVGGSRYQRAVRGPRAENRERARSRPESRTRAAVSPAALRATLGDVKDWPYEGVVVTRVVEADEVGWCHNCGTLQLASAAPWLDISWITRRPADRAVLRRLP